MRDPQGAAMWLLKQLVTGPAEAAVKARVFLKNFAKSYAEGAWKSYSTIFLFLLNRYVIDDSKAKLDGELRSIIQRSMVPEEHSQEQWTRTLRCGSVFTEESLDALFVEEDTHAVCRALRYWWAEHQNVFLVDFAQRV